jgi:hypothetical protein
MQASKFQRVYRTLFVSLALTLLMAASAWARPDDKKGSAKPAAPAKPAAAPHAAGSSGASHPSSGGASATGASHTTGHTTTTTGVSTGHTGPTTSNPSGHSGATASNPTAAHTGPTTSNPTGHSSATTSNPTGHSGATTAHATTTKTGPNAGTGHPGATGTAQAGATGKQTHTTNAALSSRPAPNGVVTHETKNGSAMQKRPNGTVREVHNTQRGMDVHHGLNGNRRVSVEHGDHRIVAERGRPGYVQRGYRYHDREFARRSYYYHGRVYNRYYNHYYYHGRYVEVYAPVRYYPPAFYGWAYNPWYQPVYYSWGWGPNPWYGYYGYYFAPAPVYPTASLWLADYLLAANLAAAYQAQQEAQLQADPVTAAGGATPITPEVRQQIADEVKNQIALENSEAQQNAKDQDPDAASSGIARLLSDGHPHVFVVGGALDVVDASSSAECALSDGDALQLAAAPPADSPNANVVVLSSKGGKECRKGTTVTVAVDDLQEMQNHMRDVVDQGLEELQTKQGKQIPALPPSAAAPPVEAGYAKAAPPADPNGAEEITKQLAEADQAESEVAAEVQQQAATTPTADSPKEAASSSAPIEIQTGQTTDQVTAALGPPLKVIDLGAKKTYVYKDMKVMFKDGKVSDVQ